MKPFITVVMPVRNEVSFIRDTLAQLVAQDYPVDCYEIIVADGESDDGTQAVVAAMSLQFPQIRLVNNSSRLSSAGRNIGFKCGRGDCFLVVDGHCYIPTTKLFENIAACFEKSAADCLGRPQPLDPPGLTTFQKAVALARGSRLGHGGDSLIYGEYEGFASPVSNGAVYTRRVFEKIGYVDENFDAAEDVEFNYRVEQAGFQCYTSPKLTIRYYPRDNLRGLFRQMTRYGRGRRKFIRKHPEALTLNQLVPVAFVIGLCCLVCSLVVLVSSGAFIALMLIAAPYCIYLIAVVVVSFGVLLKNGLRHATLIPLILFVIHFSLGYGFLREAIRALCTSDTAQLRAGLEKWSK
jgi:succinoglycan biosynthesis protein ExoA